MLELTIERVFVTSSLPWRSPDSTVRYIERTYYDQAEIDKCLSCTSAYCNNCIKNEKRRKVVR